MQKTKSKFLNYIAVASIAGLFAAPLISPQLARGATTDSFPPTVSVTSPANGATVSGTVAINATASDKYSNCVVTLFGKQYDVSPLQSGHPGGNIFNCGTDMTSVYQGEHGTNVSRMQPYLIPSTYVGVIKVEFYVDGVLRSTDTASPFSFSWNTTGVSNGSHAIRARAYDGTSNTNSNQVSVNVNNAGTTPPPTNPPPANPPAGDTALPVVSIASPAINSTVTGTFTFSVNATDNVGVARVEFYIDGSLKASDTTSPYSLQYNSSVLTGGTHTLLVKAFDAAGNAGSSAISINVNTATNSPSNRYDGDDDEDEDDDDDDEDEEEERELRKQISEKKREAEKKRREQLKEANKSTREASKKQRERERILRLIESLQRRLASIQG